MFCFKIESILKYCIVNLATNLQVTIEHRLKDGAVIPLRVHTIVISTQHNEEVEVKELRQEIMEKVPDNHLEAL